MTLSPLDDFPVHQAAQVMRHPATSDRNFYDRYYFNCHAGDDELMLIIGVGQYPNLGVTDAFALARHGDTHRVVRASRELGADRMDTSVGPFRVEVLEGLKRLRVVLEPNEHGLDFDLTWDAAIPAQLEPRHFTRLQERVIFDSVRLAQTGRWSGRVRSGDQEFTVTPDRWGGSRDRSWGIRPVGESEPPGIQSQNPAQFFWMYAPMQFDEFAILTIVQEDSAGNRLLEEAVRVWPEQAGKPPQRLGRPVYRPDYASESAPGSSVVTSATIEFDPPWASPLQVAVKVLHPVSLFVGTGYGLEQDWRHGMYQGRDLAVQSVCYDLAKPEDKARMWGMVDSVASFTLTEDGATRTGSGLFEYWAFGAHAPSGLAG
jgi:hypothetical protein